MRRLSTIKLGVVGVQLKAQEKNRVKYDVFLVGGPYVCLI